MKSSNISEKSETKSPGWMKKDQDNSFQNKWKIQQA